MTSEDKFSNNQHINLGQLFSDVSRTVSGFRDILGQSDPANNPDLQSSLKLPLSDSQQMSSSNNGQSYGSGSPLAGLFSGSTCFKTCGMEDIQWAAKRAGELFMTLRTCAVIMTIFSAIVVILLAILVVYLTYKQYQQSMEYQSSTSSCGGSYSSAENENKPAVNVSGRPPSFFSSALFHRKSDKPEERKGGTNQ